MSGAQSKARKQLKRISCSMMQDEVRGNKKQSESEGEQKAHTHTIVHSLSSSHTANSGQEQATTGKREKERLNGWSSAK